MENTQASTAAGVLRDVRELRAVSLAADAALLEQAACWADLHPAPEAELVATFHHRGRDTGMRLTADGLPDVSADCVAELAAALGLPTSGGERLIAHALELRHRLPRTWSLVQAGEVPAWRARQVADQTLSMSRDAAQFVDAQVAAVVGRISTPQLDRLIQTALIRHIPAEAERRRLEAADGRDLQIQHDTTGSRHGFSEVWGRLDLPDALALDAAVTDGARVLGQLGSTDPLGARRARALGDLARRQPGLDLTSGEPTSTHPASARSGAGTTVITATPPLLNASPGRVGTVEPVVLYLHLSAEALATGVDDGSGEVENTRCPVTVEQVREWCGRAEAKVTVRPVIDLTQDAVAESRVVPDWMRERISLRDRTCVFPYCCRPARPYPTRRAPSEDGRRQWRVDADHMIAHGDGGPTSTDNTAPLCRIHHLLKTFAGWRYQVSGARCYQWTSPHGLRYLRTPDGATHDRGDHPPGPASSAENAADVDQHGVHHEGLQAYGGDQHRAQEVGVQSSGPPRLDGRRPRGPAVLDPPTRRHRRLPYENDPVPAVSSADPPPF